MNYASTVGGGAMTMVVVRTKAEQAKADKAGLMALRQKTVTVKKRAGKMQKKVA